MPHEDRPPVAAPPGELDILAVAGISARSEGSRMRRLSLLGCMISTVSLASCGGQGREGFEEAPRDAVVAPQDFFSDTTEGRSLEAALDARVDDLQALGSASVSAEMRDRSLSYADLFDAYSKDLRGSINAAYNGYISATRRPGVSSEDAREAKSQYDESLRYSTQLTAKLRAFELLTTAAKPTPTAEDLDVLGREMRALFADTAGHYPATIEYVTKVEVGGLDRVMDNVLGNEPPAGVWEYAQNGSVRIDLPIRLSGETRITDNIDLTPFLNASQPVRFELLKVDDVGKTAFHSYMKSDIPLGSDGNRVEGEKNPGDGDTVTIKQAQGPDRAYYLAWRGTTMTKEEFAKRYPDAVVRLTIDSRR